jgi:hypothetical protein
MRSAGQYRPTTRQAAASAGTAPNVRASVLAAALSPRRTTPSASTAATRLMKARDEQPIARKERRSHRAAADLDDIQARACHEQRGHGQQEPDQAPGTHRLATPGDR